MKKLFSKLFIVGALGGLTLLASCGGDDDEPTPAGPSIVVTTEPTDVDGTITVTEGDAITFTINASTPGGFNTATITDGTNVDTKTRLTESLDVGTTAATIVFEGLVFDSPGEVTVTITVVDEIAQEVSETLTVVVEEGGIAANVFTAKLLYAQLASEDSKTFFSTNLGETVSKNQVDASAAPNSSDIDFGYAAGATGTVFLASPSSYPTFTAYDLSIWNTLNTTTFKNVTLTDEEYLAVETDLDLIALYEEGTTPEDRKTGFEAGDTFAFQLAEGKGSKKGLVKIVAIVDGNSDGDIIDSTDYLEIEVIVEQ
ncbi:hypothetical protein [Fulvivirga lutimaris]|uniref:hypothetical protein n=1 Tax=Fulvivirga lutimaris TaxID=1819566 RepID=UPI0012BC8A8B|nr:hypothetical protein [Fulvivirga lutimaris]MTI38289.1 hypothetical protein [Fulvivirga lutimaris]